ncbi:MAG: S8 family serine peptidase [Aquabacterium sp.]|uniref:S8 family serine peptidase n=1 Tax=Aquabacterium sp. TaxID=1872578 RepID=UPI00271BC1B2|nr:S8 family serine peptidase [Aquabacterium sp.]MDO9005915.1 S8 family serine peptidase [Aquabacterium sp.]
MNWQGHACGRLISWVGVMVALVFSGTTLAAETPPAAPRMAMGLIVKLKDAKPPSVVRLKASAVPSDGFSGQRQRIADVARRKRVSYLVQRPTAFGAQVIHAGHPVTWVEATAQAQRLRADPDVEWVLVNEIVKRHALGTSDLPTDPGYLQGDDSSSIASLTGAGGAAAPTSGHGQVWLQSLQGSANAGVANFPAAWDFIDSWSATHTLSPVVVAVLDTGKLDHPDMDGRWMPGYDFVHEVLAAGDGNGVDGDPTDMGDWLSAAEKSMHPEVFDSDCEEQDQSSWHGLAISGMLAANANNGQYGAGMLEQLGGPTGRPLLMPVRVAGKCGAEVSSIIEGMLWASGVPFQGSPALPTHPARIINLSFGGEGACDSTSNAGPIYLQTIATLRSNGVLLVASSGNSFVGEVRPSMPANCPGVLAATGLNQQGYKARYANMLSDGVAVASGDVNASYNLVDDGIYTLVNAGVTLPDTSLVSGSSMMQKVGTSFAAPQVVGVAAMMLAVNPSLSVQQLIDLIKSTSRHAFPSGSHATCNASVPQSNCACTTATCGSGILDAPQAVAWAASTAGAGVNASTNSGGGGGGGSLNWPELLGLASLAALALIKRRSSAQGRQAAKLLP